MLFGGQHFIQHTVDHAHLSCSLSRFLTDYFLGNIYRKYGNLAADIADGFFLLLLNLLFHIIQLFLREGFGMFTCLDE